MKLFTALCAAQAPTLGLGLIGANWKFRVFPQDGVADITFGFNMQNTPQESGYYFAQQFNFFNIPEVGYCGLQPRPSREGEQMVHAVFSSFQGGTYTTHPNCADGADGGPGVSCYVDFPGNYNHTYHIRIRLRKGPVWIAKVHDEQTKEEVEIGGFTLPGSAGLIQNGQMGFIEYYPWNSQPSHTCGSLPPTRVAFLDPSSKEWAAKGGHINNVYEYGDCVGEAGYSARDTSTGWDISVGFDNNTAIDDNTVIEDGMEEEGI